MGTLSDQGREKREEGKEKTSSSETDAKGNAPPEDPRRRMRRFWWGFGAFLLLLLSLPPLLRWQQGELRRARSLNNMRRLATGLLLYAQDWDGRLMAPASRLADGHWLTWPDLTDAYVEPSSVFVNPGNPPGSTPPKHPKDGYEARAGYALNHRFWNVFAPGPFPLDNLELPEKTVLLVEAGPMWNDPRRPTRTSDTALLAYGDTTDRVNGFVPYPSPHGGKMTVVTVDGHGETIEVRHYGPEGGPHDPLYGRLGKDIYNWNGGHPNGETDTPPRE